MKDINEVLEDIKQNLKLFSFWDQDNEDWIDFNTLEDAVKEAPEGIEIYERIAKPIGKYKIKTVLVKDKRRKKAAK